MFLKTSQNSQENTCARVSFLIKLQASACNFIKKVTLWHRCFPVNYANFLRIPFYKTPPGDCFCPYSCEVFVKYSQSINPLPRGFLIFSGGIEREYWPEMSEITYWPHNCSNTFSRLAKNYSKSTMKTLGQLL